jgi:hypothetical protein
MGYLIMQLTLADGLQGIYIGGGNNPYRGGCCPPHPPQASLLGTLWANTSASLWPKPTRRRASLRSVVSLLIEFGSTYNSSCFICRTTRHSSGPRHISKAWAHHNRSHHLRVTAPHKQDDQVDEIDLSVKHSTWFLTSWTWESWPLWPKQQIWNKIDLWPRSFSYGKRPS